jgi:hypothetical protein
VHIEIRYFDECPSWRALQESVEAIARGRELDATVTLTRVDTREAAEQLAFRGSPTILIDCEDPDDPDAPVGLSCRIYRTDEGFAGRPSDAEVETALMQRL